MTTVPNNTDEIRQAVQDHYGQRALRVIQLTDVTPQGEGCGAETLRPRQPVALTTAARKPRPAVAAIRPPPPVAAPRTPSAPWLCTTRPSSRACPWRRWRPPPAAATPPRWPTCAPAKPCWTWAPAAASTASIAAEQVGESGRVLRAGHDPPRCSRWPTPTATAWASPTSSL